MIDDLILAHTVVTTWVRHTSSWATWSVQAEIDEFFAESTSVSWLACALKVVASEVLACTIIFAWEHFADTCLFDWLFNGASSQFLVPEEHISAFADSPSVLTGALQKHVQAS